jgi:eukaryotic-like serine/threonine-protein kinase
VAVKIIADRFAHVPPFVRQFRREAELCARLAHPKIVTILDAGDDPQHFIVMELVRGLDAGKLMRRVGPLTPEQTVHVIAQVSEALEYAHEEDVVHRDVSPRNILIRLPDGTAKLAGFGVPLDAVAVRHALGTPGYVAPEILRGVRPSPRSDLYSLGAVAYRLLAGPSEGRSEIRPDLSRAVNEAIHQALADDPDERQDSVAQFRAQLVGERRARGLQRAPAALFPQTVRAALRSAA